MSLPSAKLQASVVRKAYSRACLPLDETCYVEAHGTGTAVGDPIEVEGLVDAFGPRASSNKLLVGSVKTNLGHSEGASGLSSVIKVVLAQENGLIPPTIGITSLNPRLEHFGNQVTIVRKAMLWPNNLVRRAGVNSFGFGGANAHVILEYDIRQLQQARSRDLLNDGRKRFLVPFSARTESSLRQWKIELSHYTARSLFGIEDLVFTLGCKRSVLSSRSYIIAAKEDISSACETHNRRMQRTNLEAQSNKHTQMVFVFTGQGAQWSQMGAGLLQRFPVFQRTILQLDEILKDLAQPPSWTLSALLEGQESSWDINTAEISQPLCTAVQIALADLLEDWNVRPGTVIGHSSGEIAAGYCAGAFNTRDAMSIAYYRGLVVSKTAVAGAMAAVGLGQSATMATIAAAGFSDSVQVACINSPESTTISGNINAVSLLVAQLHARNVFARILKTDGRAYHSRHMFEIGEAYEAMLQQITWKSRSRSLPEVRVVSSVHGCDISPTELRSPRYWRMNLERPVNFEAAVAHILKQAKCSFVELGSHSALQMPLQQIQSKEDSDTEVSYFSSLVREQSPVEALLGLAGELFMNGYNVSVERVNDLRDPKILVDLPKYVWQYDDLLWTESRSSKEFRNRDHPRHYLLGSRIPGASGIIWSWRNILRTRDVPWIQDHKLGDAMVLPAAAFINIAIEALRQYEELDLTTGAIFIRNLKIKKALVIPEDDVGVETVTDFQALPLTSITRSRNHFVFEVSSFAETTPLSHVTGQISFERPNHAASSNPFDCDKYSECYTTKGWYDGLEIAGLRFGPQFRTLRRIHNAKTVEEDGNHHTVAEVIDCESASTGCSSSEDAIHTPLIDSLFQVSIISNAGGLLRNVRARIPVSVDEIYLDFSSKVDRGTVRAHSELRGSSVTQNTASLFDSSHRLRYRMENVRLVEYNTIQLHTASQRRHPILRVKWLPDITLLRSKQRSQFKQYLSDTQATHTNSVSPLAHVYSTILNLILHKSSSVRLLLLIASSDDLLQNTIDILQAVSGLQRIQSMTAARPGSNGLLGKTFEDIPSTVTDMVNVGDKKLNSNEAFDFVINLTVSTKFLLFERSHG